MGIWDMIMIVAVVGILSEFVKFLVKNHRKSNTVSKDELAKIRDTISTMRTDLDEIKADVRTVVIQMDDIKLYKADSSVVDEKNRDTARRLDLHR